MSQCDEVLRRLKRGPLTPAEAFTELGVYRLAARINNLRDAGHNIVTDWQETNGKRYARYRLIRVRKRAAA